MTATPGTPIPQLAASGFATFYMTVPAGSFSTEQQLAFEALSQLRGAVDGKPPEVLYLLGQADLAARVELKDFRVTIESRYPGAHSTALVANAVFTMPYVFERKNAAEPSASARIRFLSHLRTRRTAYEIDPVHAEAAILDALRELTDQLGATVSIEAGIGWADFIISGSVAVEHFQRLLRWLVQFNSVRLPEAIGGHEYVFRRTLTLIGYAWERGATEQPAPVIADLPNVCNAILFIRARAGRLGRVKEAVKTAFPDARVEFIDGKLDVIAIVDKPSDAFLQDHQRLFLAEGTDCIERLETHLLFSEEPDEFRPPIGTAGACACPDLATAIANTLQREPFSVLPAPTAAAVRNIAFLFSSTLRESANCCDARVAIHACWKSLWRLVVEAARLHATVDKVDATIASGTNDRDKMLATVEPHNRFMRMIHKIDLWLLTSERVLRQRSVGSFEEFLGHSDRALSYGGGVQKGLFVADNLMNDFYAKVTGKKRRDRFASLYDSVDRIMSVVGMSFVRVPVKDAFYLPGALPDMWHEVGSHLFFETFHYNDLVRPSPRLYYDLADHYGDLVAFVYGFELDFGQFLTAMVRGWWRSIPKTARPAAAQWAYAQLLARLAAVLEFFNERTEPLVTAMDRRIALADSLDEIEGMVRACIGPSAPAPDPVNRKRALDNLLSEELHDGLTRLRSQIPDRDVEEAYARLEDAWAEPGMPLLTPAPLSAFTPETDMNREFRRLYWAIESRRSGPDGRSENYFAPLAALARSAALEYYRRISLRHRKRPSPTPRARRSPPPTVATP